MDQAAEEWAVENEIPTRPFPVSKEEWAEYGRLAGQRRNHQMAVFCASFDEPTYVIAFPHRILKSSGTRGMIDIARGMGFPVLVTPIPKPGKTA